MKVKLLFVVFILLYVAIVARLFYVQIVMKDLGGQDLYLKTRNLPAERGRIYDQNGNPIVLNQNSYLLYLSPKKIGEKYRLVDALSEKLDMDKATLEAKINEKLVYQAIKGGIDEEKKKEIEDLKLPGVGFEYEMRRFYPEASLSAHLTGFVGKNDKGENVGYFGLEGFYDKDLSGLPGILQTERDVIGRPIFVGTQNKVDPENGRDLYLTIDKSVQEIAKRRLKEGIENYKAKQGCVVIAEPNTMAIIALTCLPDYDMDRYFEFNERYFEDPVVSEVYEPGSIFKPLVMAAALDAKKIKPDSEMDEDGPVTIGEYTIRTWDDTYAGRISMTRILEKSSNVGMVYIGDKLGDKLLYSYLEKYGFGEATGIDLQGETTGYLKPFNAWYPIDFSTVTFGQGIAVTPIQMVRAFAAIINGGKLMKPYVVSKVVTGNREKVISPVVERKVIDPRTSEVIKKMLVSTVEHAEAKWDRPKGYKIGGKTGTAQIAIQGHYDPSKTNASFIGFAPAENPKFITMVMLKEPGTSPWGSETAAPLFFNIAKELLVYYNISPTQ
ncbi:MAG: peptidoglycan D,D-transpeptidase FtsI family protein [Patescibacteria group bacterium]